MQWGINCCMQTEALHLAQQSSLDARAFVYILLLIILAIVGGPVIPAAKPRRRPDDIPSFAEQQLAILSGRWPLLKPGGVLLYATCSVLREENAQVIARFLEGAADARIDPIDEAYGVNLGGALQLLPSANGSDGLFYCRLQRL